MLQSLIVVYKKKDEMAVNMLRKLVETNDDKEGEIVGTEDGTVDIIPWSEKVWLENKDAGNIGEKVLFIGDIKGAKDLLPIIDTKYHKHGIIYGWAGTQAILTLKQDKETPTNYEDFMSDLEKYYDDSIANGKHKLGKNKRTIVKGILMGLPIIRPFAAGSLIKDGLDDAKEMRKQKLLLGIIEFYMNHLEQFIKG